MREIFQYGNDKGSDYRNDSYYSGRNTNIFIVISITAILFLISLTNYLLFHSIAEGFSIVIGCTIFIIIWNSRKYFENNFFIIIGIAFLFISVIDFMHAVTYSGVNGLPGNGANLPTQLWIAARYLQSITFLAATLFIGKRITIFKIGGIYLSALILIFITIFYWKVFPVCYIENVGLTTFKMVSEYIISLIFMLAIFLLYRKKEEFAPVLFMLIIFSIIISIASEINFSFYTSPYGMANFNGHILKIFSSYLIYKAFIVSGLQDPFNVLFKKLKQNERDLQLTRFSINNSRNLLFWIKLNGSIYDFNQTVPLKLGYTSEELKIRSIFDFFYSPTHEFIEGIKLNILKHETFTIEYPLISKYNDRIEMELEFTYLNFEGEEFYYLFMRDITERRKAEAKLYESEARFRNLADTAPVMIWMADDKKQCTYINKPWLEFTGRTAEEELGYGWSELMHPDDKPKCMEDFNNAFEKKIALINESRMKRQDGQYRWILNTGIPRFTNDGTFLGYIGSCIDITDLKLSREQLEYSLQEKVVLLKEIHHRVKNNLQVISSLFNLQADFIRDEEAREIFMESQNRVKSMALLHEKLYLSKNSTYINFSEYLRDLITNLLNSYKYNLNTIDLEIIIENLDIDVDTAVYLGLIVNELISNVFKHAFTEGKGSDGSKSRLSIHLKNIVGNKYIIIIKDNGKGFPEKIDFRNTDTLGMQLVNSLVDQIKGEIELRRNCGTEFYVSFNLNK